MWPALYGHGTAQVLAFVARRTQGDQAVQALDGIVVVVVPNFMRFNRPPGSATTTDFATVVGTGIRFFAKTVPFGFW